MLFFQGRVELLADDQFQDLLKAQESAAIPKLKSALKAIDRWPSFPGAKDPPRERRRVLLESLLGEFEKSK